MDLSRAAILELWRGLHGFKDSIVLVGGWAPYFILERSGGDTYEHDHIGSIDIDIAVDPSMVSKDRYRTMESLLFDLDYSSKKDTKGVSIPFIFEKTYFDGRFSVEVDILTSNYGARGHRHHRISGLLARRCHGVDIAFKRFFEFSMKGELPYGGRTKEIIRVADIVGSLTMKGIVLGERYKEKDAYDIYYLITHYIGGPKNVAYEMRKCISDPLVMEALRTIEKEFSERDSAGTVWASDFLDEMGDERERRLTDVHMNVMEFLKYMKR